MTKRLVPDRVQLGSMYNVPLSSATRFKGDQRISNPQGLRTALGFLLPEWQRPFVWEDGQCVRFIESIWKGPPLGSYTVNLKVDSEFDGYLIDGQQRLTSIERYLSDEFPVFGYKWSEVTLVDRRVFETGYIFPYYETRSDDENYLREYYELMNFGETPHES